MVMLYGHYTYKTFSDRVRIVTPEDGDHTIHIIIQGSQYHMYGNNSVLLNFTDVIVHVDGDHASRLARTICSSPMPVSHESA